MNKPFLILSVLTMVHVLAPTKAFSYVTAMLNDPNRTPSVVYQNSNNQQVYRYSSVPAFASAPPAERSKILYREGLRHPQVYLPSYESGPISSYYADYQPEPYEANFYVPPKRMGSEHAFKSGGASGSGAAGVGAASAGVGSGGVGGGVQ